MQKFVVILVVVVVIFGGAWLYLSKQSEKERLASEAASNGLTDEEQSLENLRELLGDDFPGEEGSTPVTPVIEGSFSGKTISVYDGISVPANATVLDLSNRGLSGSLKAEIRHLSGLKTLNLSGNNFTGLPAEVGQLTRLQTLDLSDNPLTGLPNELGNLKSLKSLDLRGTQYSELDLATIKSRLPESTIVFTD